MTPLLSQRTVRNLVACVEMAKIHYTRFPVTSGKLPTCCGLVADLLRVSYVETGDSILVFFPRDALVLKLHVVRPSVCLSVYL